MKTILILFSFLLGIGNSYAGHSHEEMIEIMRKSCNGELPENHQLPITDITVACAGKLKTWVPKESTKEFTLPVISKVGSAVSTSKDDIFIPDAEVTISESPITAECPEFEMVKVQKATTVDIDCDDLPEIETEEKLTDFCAEYLTQIPGTNTPTGITRNMCKERPHHPHPGPCCPECPACPEPPEVCEDGDECEDDLRRPRRRGYFPRHRR